MIKLKKIVLPISIVLIIIAITYLLFLKKEKIPVGILVLSGRIEGRETNITPKIQERIIRLYKDEGDKVSEGELLCELDPERIKAKYQNILETTHSAFSALRITEANLKKARVSYEKIKKDFERYKNLIKEGVISKSEFERMKMQYELAEAEVDAITKSISQAEANYMASLAMFKEIKNELGETKIYSPVDGTILSRPVEPGEVVNPGKVIYVIVNLHRLYVKVYVPEPDIGKLKLSLPARVYVDAYKNKYFVGRITKIYEQAEFTPKNVETKEERVKLVFGVEVSVDNSEGLLKPGMPADVVIKWKDDAQWIELR